MSCTTLSIPYIHCLGTISTVGQFRIVIEKIERRRTLASLSNKIGLWMFDLASPPAPHLYNKAWAKAFKRFIKSNCAYLAFRSFFLLIRGLFWASQETLRFPSNTICPWAAFPITDRPRWASTRARPACCKQDCWHSASGTVALWDMEIWAQGCQVLRSWKSDLLVWEVPIFWMYKINLWSLTSGVG